MKGAASSPTGEGRRERKKRELRERIYQTARMLFLERGFEATTVEQIAEAADVAQATFFNHFAGKNAVLAEMTREVSERLRELIGEQLARRVSAQAKIRAFGQRAGDEVEASLGLARDVLLELVRTSPRPGEAFSYVAGAHAAFVDILREGQTRGEVRSDYDAGFLADMVVGAFNGAAIRWLNDPAYPLAERLRRTGAFIGEAIAPPASRRKTVPSSEPRAHPPAARTRVPRRRS
jgi:AcrR family transcriptional regulator